MKYYLDIAMRNSYEVIVNKMSLDNFVHTSNSYFMHNPNEEITDDILKDMYNYFKLQKECDKLVKIGTLRAKIKFYDTAKRLSRVYSKEGN